jgi:hypothetical protein
LRREDKEKNVDGFYIRERRRRRRRRRKGRRGTCPSVVK